MGAIGGQGGVDSGGVRPGASEVPEHRRRDGVDVESRHAVRGDGAGEAADDAQRPDVAGRVAPLLDFECG